MAQVTSRYARAFAEVVFDAKLDLAATISQLQAMAQAFQASDDLRRVWDSPSIPAEQKRSVLDALLAQVGQVPRELRNFLAVLIDHGRIVFLPEIARQVEAELNQRSGRIQAEVTTSRPLGETERKDLASRIAEVTGKQVAATYSVDESLLGGAVVRVGSTVYDGSVRGQLVRMKQQLSAE